MDVGVLRCQCRIGHCHREHYKAHASHSFPAGYVTVHFIAVAQPSAACTGYTHTRHHTDITQHTGISGTLPPSECCHNCQYPFLGSAAKCQLLRKSRAKYPISIMVCVAEVKPKKD